MRERESEGEREIHIYVQITTWMTNIDRYANTAGRFGCIWHMACKYECGKYLFGTAAGPRAGPQTLKGRGITGRPLINAIHVTQVQSDTK